MKENLVRVLIAMVILLSAGMARAAIVRSGSCGANGSNLTWKLSDEGVLTISGSGAMKDWENWSSSPFALNSSIKFVILEEGVTSIGNYAFNDCNGLTSVVIPGTVTSIGENTFAYCSELPSLVIPKSVTSIGMSAFSHCSALTSITVNENNTIYDSRENCNAIIETATNALIAGCKTTVIPESVASIGWYAFNGCNGLKSIVIPGSVTSIDDFAFSSCVGLSSIVLPESLTSIGIRVFSDCRGLSSIELPGSLTSIGKGAFSGCRGLTSVEIPESLTRIGSYAFEYCSGLTVVYVMRETPINYDKFFYGCDLNHCILYVPAGSGESYQTAEGWKEFENIVEIANDVEIEEGTTTYQNGLTLSDVTVTYTRNFGNTAWQALYVPFSIRSEEWCKNYEVAYINSVRQYDSDSDGNIDETIMDIIKIASGTLRPNTPYLIKAKATGEQSIVAQHTILTPTEQNSISCSTMLSTFTFTGTYQTIAASTLIANSYYAMGGGNLVMTDGTSDLKPFRWYMDITSRSPIYDAPVANPTQIRVRVVGEQDETETHLYRMTKEEAIDVSLFNINGQRIDNQKHSGLQICNGKLQFIK